MTAAMRRAAGRGPSQLAGHWALRAVWVLAHRRLRLYIPTKTETEHDRRHDARLQLAIAAMALNLVMGYGGIVSLGHSAYFGLGGYTTAVLVDHYGWSQGWTLYVAAVFGFVVGCLTSLPALRLKGVYLALVTLGLAVLFPQLIKWQKLEWLTGGARGIDDLQYDDIPQLADPRRAATRATAGRCSCTGSPSSCVVAVVPRVPRHREEPGRALADRHPRQRDRRGRDGRRPAPHQDARLRHLGGDVRRRRGAVRHRRATSSIPTVRRASRCIGSIMFVVVMVLGGAATLWGPIVGAIVYVVRRDADPRVGRPTATGLVGARSAGLTGSPATLILAVVLLLHDVRRPVRHRRPAQAPRRQGRRHRSEPGGHR